MRMGFGVLGLLMAVAVVAVLAKKQLGPPPATAQAAAQSASEGASPVPSGSPQQQVQQAKKSIEAAMQQARPMPDDETK